MGRQRRTAPRCHPPPPRPSCPPRRRVCAGRGPSDRPDEPLRARRQPGVHLRLPGGRARRRDNAGISSGLAEAAQSLYTAEAADRFAAALRYFAGGRVVIVVTGEPYKGPGVPYETAMVLEASFHSRRMRQKIELDVYSRKPRPCPSPAKRRAKPCEACWRTRASACTPAAPSTSVDAQRRELTFDDGSNEPFQLLVAIPEHRAPAVLREAGLTDDTGWVPVDRFSLATAHTGVYAIGDAVSLPTPNGTMLPRLGVLAQAQARAVARQIAWRLNGGRTPRPFDARGSMTLEVGAGAAMELTGDFLSSRRPLVVKQPSIAWRLTKAAAERAWLFRTY